jgi:FixJ family two-component response regulator
MYRITHASAGFGLEAGRGGYAVVASVFTKDVKDTLVKARRPAYSASMSEAPIIHIIDDEESLRFALGSLFRSIGLASRSYSSVSEFLAARRPDVPGCLILDVRLPGMSGLDFQAQLAAFGVQLPVILITGHGDVPMSVRGMKAGAVDFLIKPFRDQDMLDAVTAAIERDSVRRTAEKELSNLRSRFETLSPREQQVMQLVVVGKMNKQIAGDLKLSQITVKIHRGAAMRKMGAHTLADLVRMAEYLKPVRLVR